MIHLLIIQGCQSGSVCRGGQSVSWSGWSGGLGGPGGPGGQGGQGCTCVVISQLEQYTY